MSWHPRRSLAVLTVVTATTLAVGSAANAAWDVAGTGNGSVGASALLAPASVTATASSSSGVQITWSSPSGQPAGTGYEVVRDGRTTLSCSSSPCTDSGLNAGTTYSYVVSAKLGTSWVMPGNQATATTHAEAPATATSLVLDAPSSVTAGSSTSVTLTAARTDGSTDTSYNGTRTVSWSGTATQTSPAGDAATLPQTATFTNGVATVNVTLVTAGAGRTLGAAITGLSSATDSLAVNAAAGSFLGFREAAVSGQHRASSTVDCIFSCSFPNLGNNGSITTKVAVFDAYGNKPADRTSNLTVAVATTGSGTGTVNLTIPAGSTVSTGTVSASGGTANYSYTLTATAGGFTSRSASISK